MKRNGFTLIELLVVVAILAILAAIIVPIFLRAFRVSGSLSHTQEQNGVVVKQWERRFSTR